MLSPSKIWCHSYCGSVIRLCDPRALWLNGCKSLRVNHHFAKFGHRHYGSGDTMVLICHLTSQDHSRARHFAAKFGSYRQCIPGDIMMLVGQMISENHVLKGSCDFMGGR